MDTASSPLEAPADADDRPAYERTADYQVHLEEGGLQPHQRYAERPPFYPTHVFAELSVHLDGEVHVIQERREVMVIDGLGYTRESWESGTLPDYDVDRHGNWYDLTRDCQVVPGHWGPETLPERWAMWRETDGAEHLFEIAPTRGGVRELPRPDGPAGVAVSDGLESRCALTQAQRTRLRDAVTRLPEDGWEVTRGEALTVARGESVDLGDGRRGTGPDAGAALTSEHSPTSGRPIPGIADLPAHAQDGVRAAPFADRDDPFAHHWRGDANVAHDPDADPTLDMDAGAHLAPAS